MNGGGSRITRRQCMALLAGTGAVALTPGFCAGEIERSILRVAVSKETLAGANVNDARAAYRVWINEISLLHGHATAEVVPDVFISSEDLTRGVRQGLIDTFGATALEFAKLGESVDPEFVLIQDFVNEGIEHLLLVHRNSPFNKIADLRGAQILWHLQPDMVLLPVWLGLLLATSNLPQAERFFGSLTHRDKLNQVVLPLFFRSVDAACVTRNSWDTAVELNPQLGRDLRPLAVSPKVIPIAIGFRRNCNAEGRKMIIDTILHISTTTSGQQIAALFQSRGFVLRSTSAMKSTLELVRQYERISAEQAGLRKGRP